MKKIIVYFTAIFVMTAVHTLAAPEVNEIVKKANNASYYQGDDGKAKVIMTITDRQGRKRIREFIILRKDKTDGGDQFYYVYFKKPSDVRKMVFMVWKHPGKDDDRWLYLPSMDLVKRISASDKRTSFAGSDFFYEDVSGRSIDEDSHKLVEETGQYYILNSIPKNLETVEFASYKIWIDKKSHLPVKAEYLNKSGKKYRTVEALDIKNVQNLPTVIRSRVTNYESGSVTVLEFKDIRYNLGLKANIFTERYLRRAPGVARR